MEEVSRYLEQTLVQDALASHKMAFLSGPRQSGKTTLAERLLKTEGNLSQNYFNWDDVVFRQRWMKSPSEILPLLTTREGESPLVVLDEIHKYKNWKNLLKGFYDLHRKRVRILITGSARLNVYRKSGDSLAGRYIPYRLHPFTLGESSVIKLPPKEHWPSASQTRVGINDLLMLGGFPEPLFSGRQAKADRWWRLYREQLIREDLRDLKAVREIQQIDLLTTLLLSKVGGGFSYQSLQEDLSVSFATIRDWVLALEAIFLCFQIRPYSKRIQGALKKEPKIYFYHWPAVSSFGARLENLVACHLLKSVNVWTDCAQGNFELSYIRDKMKREVDFCVTESGKPWLLLEVKSSGSALSPALVHYTELLKPKYSIQLIEAGKSRSEKITTNGSRILRLSVDEFLSSLN
jgi:uncharacterized protein